MSMTSWAMAPATGGRRPTTASSMPSELSDDPADRGLEGDPPHAAADVHELVEPLKRGVEDDGVGRLGGDVIVLAERDANRCSRHCGGVVDAVTEEDGRREGGLLPDDRELALRGHLGEGRP